MNEDDVSVDCGNLSLVDFMRVWLFEVMRVSAAYSTFDRYEGIFRNYVINLPFAGLLPREVKRLMIQKHYNLMFESGSTTSQIKNLNKLLKTFFNYVICEGYMTANPCFKIIIPRIKEGIDDFNIRPFSDEELEAIGSNMRPEYKMIFLLALGTGLRRGELFALTMADIDFERREVRVNKTVRSVRVINKDGTYKYKVVVKPPKTRNSNRFVPIPSGLIPLLARHMTEQKKKFVDAGLDFCESSMIFTTGNCSCIRGENFFRSWQRALKRAGIKYRNFHTVRHTYATKLFEQSIPIKTVQMLLGHANMSITADVYTHVIPRKRENAVEVLNYLFE